MHTFAFMLDGRNAWTSVAADLITPGFLWIPAVLALLCAFIVVRNHRNVSYALGLAAVPAVLVFGGLFFKTLQYDLRDFPAQQMGIALFVALFPAFATGVVYVLRRWASKESRLPEALRQPSPACAAAVCIPQDTRSAIRYSGGDGRINEESLVAKTLLIGLTACSWLLISSALVLISACALVASSMRGHRVTECDGALWCLAGAFLFSVTASMAWFFGVRTAFKREHHWARWCAGATYLAVPSTVATLPSGRAIEDNVTAATVVLVGTVTFAAAVLSVTAITLRRRLSVRWQIAGR